MIIFCIVMIICYLFSFDSPYLIAAGLFAIASAIDYLAESVKNKKL